MAVFARFTLQHSRYSFEVSPTEESPTEKKSESDQMVEALKKQGVDVPYMIKDNEGHGFYNEENRFDFYREMTEFLEKYLKN